MLNYKPIKCRFLQPIYQWLCDVNGFMFILIRVLVPLTNLNIAIDRTIAVTCPLRYNQIVSTGTGVRNYLLNHQLILAVWKPLTITRILAVNFQWFNLYLPSFTPGCYSSMWLGDSTRFCLRYHPHQPAHRHWRRGFAHLLRVQRLHYLVLAQYYSAPTLFHLPNLLIRFGRRELVRRLICLKLRLFSIQSLNSDHFTSQSLKMWYFAAKHIQLTKLISWHWHFQSQQLLYHLW